MENQNYYSNLKSKEKRALQKEFRKVDSTLLWAVYVLTAFGGIGGGLIGFTSVSLLTEETENDLYLTLLLIGLAILVIVLPISAVISLKRQKLFFAWLEKEKGMLRKPAK